MQQITINVNPSIYEHIMFFLENLPKNLVTIKKEFQEKPNKRNPLTTSFNPREFFGVASSSKSEIDSYLKENQNEWDSYIEKR